MTQHFDKYAGNNESKQNLRTTIFRGGLITVSAQAAIFILNLISVSVLSRLLKPDDFGIVAVVNSFIAVILSIQEAGFADVIVRLSEVSEKQFSKAFWLNLMLALVLCIAIAVASPCLGFIYSDWRVSNVALAFIGVVLLSNLPILHKALLRRRLNMRHLASIQVISFCIGFFSATIAALCDLQYWSLVIMQLTRAASDTFLTYCYCPVLPGSVKSIGQVEGMTRDGSYFSASSLVSSLGRNVDNLLVGFYSGKAALGEYTRAYALLLLPIRQIVAPIGYTTIPILSRLLSEPERYKKAYVEIMTRLLMITTPGISLLIVVAHPMCNVLLGDGWTQVPAIFQWLGIASIVQPFTVSLSWLMVSQGRSFEHFRNMSYHTLVLIILFLISAPIGVKALAMTYGISGIVFRSPWITWLVLKKGPVQVRDALHIIAPGVLGACVVVAVSLVAIPFFESNESKTFGTIFFAGLSLIIFYFCYPQTRNIVLSTLELVKVFKH